MQKENGTGRYFVGGTPIEEVNLIYKVNVDGISLIESVTTQLLCSLSEEERNRCIEEISKNLDTSVIYKDFEV